MRGPLREPPQASSWNPWLYGSFICLGSGLDEAKALATKVLEVCFYRWQLKFKGSRWWTLGSVGNIWLWTSVNWELCFCFLCVWAWTSLFCQCFRVMDGFCDLKSWTLHLRFPTQIDSHDVCKCRIEASGESGHVSREAKVIAGPTAKFVLECAVEHQLLPQTQRPARAVAIELQYSTSSR